MVWNVGTVNVGASVAVTYFFDVTSCASNTMSVQAVMDVASPPQTITSGTANASVVCLTDTPTWTATATLTFTPTNTGTPSNTPTITDTPTNTYTPTVTSTPTYTGTPTNTYTPTNTGTPTLTYTPTCVTHVWPDPYIPQKAFQGTLKISCMSSNSKVSIFTVSGELVQTLDQSDACQVTDGWGTVYCWNGRNRQQYPVATGVYLYVVQSGDKVVQRGKFLLTNSS